MIFLSIQNINRLLSQNKQASLYPKVFPVVIRDIFADFPLNFVTVSQDFYALYNEMEIISA